MPINNFYTDALPEDKKVFAQTFQQEGLLVAKQQILSSRHMVDATSKLMATSVALCHFSWLRTQWKMHEHVLRTSHSMVQASLMQKWMIFLTTSKRKGQQSDAGAFIPLTNSALSVHNGTTLTIHTKNSNKNPKGRHPSCLITKSNPIVPNHVNRWQTGAMTANTNSTFDIQLAETPLPPQNNLPPTL